MKKKPAKPKRPKRTMMMVQVTPTQKAEIRANAHAAEKTVSEFVRDRAMEVK